MTVHISQIEHAIALLKEASHAIGLTGAGISTPSGIPDFRSPDTGAWAHIDPMEVASIRSFRHNPQKFYDWIYPMAKLTLAAEPNSAHLALAQLEQNGRLHSLITQNIDMLHTRAGSQTVYEMHGHLRQATCLSCQRQYDGVTILTRFMQTGATPICTHCQGVIKPDVVLFGELLPLKILQAAQAAVESCDLMLVAGSSLEVSPVGDLPLIAKQNGARLIIVNWGDTHLDSIADLVIHADVVDVLPQLAASFLP